MVEVEQLLAEMEVLQRRRSARADLQAVLVVGDGQALLGGKGLYIVAGDLMGLTALAGEGPPAVLLLPPFLSTDFCCVLPVDFLALPPPPLVWFLGGLDLAALPTTKR